MEPRFSHDEPGRWDAKALRVLEGEKSPPPLPQMCLLSRTEFFKITSLQKNSDKGKRKRKRKGEQRIAHMNNLDICVCIYGLGRGWVRLGNEVGREGAWEKLFSISSSSSTSNSFPSSSNVLFFLLLMFFQVQRQDSEADAGVRQGELRQASVLPEVRAQL